MDGLPDGKRLKGRDLALEARLIAEAEAEAEAGLLVSAAEVKAWIDSLATPEPLPMPSPLPRSR